MAMIELAPNHKTGLVVKSPLLTAAGCWGFADEYAGLIDFTQLGAFVTNPLTLRPRKPARAQQAIPLPEGLLLHTGLPNPGLRAARRQYAPRWSRLPCPVIVHLAATDPQATFESAERLEGLENVVGIELGFRDEEHPQAITDMIAAAAAGLLPVIARAPFGRAFEFADLATQAGAVALTIAAPPRGRLPAAQSDAVIRGRLYGPAYLPQLLQLLHELIPTATLPVIAVGGVHTSEQVRACLTAGARAVQLDSVVWVSPEQVIDILAEFSSTPEGEPVT